MAMRFRKQDGPSPSELASPRLAKMMAKKAAPAPKLAPPQPVAEAVQAPAPAAETFEQAVETIEEVEDIAAIEAVEEEAVAAETVVPEEEPAPAAQAQEPIPQATPQPAPQAAPIPVPSRAGDPTDDERWARENLRWNGDKPFLDLANVIRVLERHPDFNSRFRYNDTISKVLDRGSVMPDWRMMDVCATVQERFLPEVPEETFLRALAAHANRATAKK